MESFLPGGHDQPLLHDLLGGVVRQLEVVQAGVDGGVGAVAGVDLANDRQPGVEVRKAA